MGCTCCDTLGHASKQLCVDGQRIVNALLSYCMFGPEFDARHEAATDHVRGCVTCRAYALAVGAMKVDVEES